MALVRPGSIAAAVSVAGLSSDWPSDAPSPGSRLPSVAHLHGRLLRECMGVEPTTERCERPLNGFEDRGPHRRPRTLKA